METRCLRQNSLSSPQHTPTTPVCSYASVSPCRKVGSSSPVVPSVSSTQSPRSVFALSPLTTKPHQPPLPSLPPGSAPYASPPPPSVSHIVLRGIMSFPASHLPPASTSPEPDLPGVVPAVSKFLGHAVWFHASLLCPCRELCLSWFSCQDPLGLGTQPRSPPGSPPARWLVPPHLTPLQTCIVWLSPCLV